MHGFVLLASAASAVLAANTALRARTHDMVRQPAVLDVFSALDADDTQLLWHAAEESSLPHKAVSDLDDGLLSSVYTLPSFDLDYTDDDWVFAEDDELFPGESQGQWFFQPDPDDTRPAQEAEQAMDWEAWFLYIRDHYAEYVAEYGEPVQNIWGERIYPLGQGVGHLVWIPYAEDDDADYDSLEFLY